MPSFRAWRMLCASAAHRGLYTSARSFAWACLCSSSHTGFLCSVWHVTRDIQCMILTKTLCIMAVVDLHSMQRRLLTECDELESQTEHL